MTAFMLEPVERFWRCPSCETVDRTVRYDVHTQFHICPGLDGINIPLVEVSSPDSRPYAKQVLVEREDYLNGEIAGPISAVRTERGDGSNDVTVFAPTATMDLSA